MGVVVADLGAVCDGCLEAAEAFRSGKPTADATHARNTVSMVGSEWLLDKLAYERWANG